MYKNIFKYSLYSFPCGLQKNKNKSIKIKIKRREEKEEVFTECCC